MFQHIPSVALSGLYIDTTQIVMYGTAMQIFAVSTKVCQFLERLGNKQKIIHLHFLKILCRNSVGDSDFKILAQGRMIHKVKFKVKAKVKRSRLVKLPLHLK